MFNLTTKPILFDADRFFDSFFSGTEFPGVQRAEHTMQVNIKEKEDAFEVIARVPGVKKEEISLDVENDILTLSVNKNENTQEENENFLRREYHELSMKRSFKLKDIDKDAITAKLDQGILTLILPKKELLKTEAKKIVIE